MAEILLLVSGAFLLGFVTYFFIVSRKGHKESPMEMQKLNKGLDEWKRKYFNDMEAREKQVEDINQQLYEATENNKLYTIEIEELRKQLKKLHTDKDTYRNNKPPEEKTDYLAQLQQAQDFLTEHNERINQLLQQIDIVKAAEEKQEEMRRDNEELTQQIEKQNTILKEKEAEISQIKQKQQITSEMSSMLDNAYSEFNILQTKIVKLESQLTSSKIQGMEYEDLKEAHYKITKELEESKANYHHTQNENLHLQARVEELEDKLRETIFQKQQLQKKVTYLEDLTSDLKQVSEANKKLEGQMKRIGELESLLNIISEERDHQKKQKDEEE